LSDTILGAIIAGGRSTRFGEPKALAKVAGERIIDRVAEALQGVTSDLVVIANDDDIAGSVRWPTRPDAVAGLGAIGGVLTALRWAIEREQAGVLVVACDMPFVSRPLLARLIERAQASPRPDLVVPSSDGPRGIEPLCAFYAVACAAPIQAAIDREDPRMIGFHADVVVDRVPLDEVRSLADPALAFMNVNTPADMERAEHLAEAMRA